MKKKIILDYEINIKKKVDRNKKLDLIKWEHRHDYEGILAMTSLQHQPHDQPGNEPACDYDNKSKQSAITNLKRNQYLEMFDIMKDPGDEE